MDSLKTTGQMAHPDAELTTCTGNHMVSGNGTGQTAHSGKENTITRGILVGSGNGAGQTVHLGIKDTFSLSNDSSTKSI